ncbi:unnamed protein product [Owenia fusiformis]|nr:unnamed protein product [Owenia fusiformis]
MEGEFKFVSSGLRCTPLTINVGAKQDIKAEVTDTGFSPRVIHIDERHAIKWTWAKCDVPHTVYEVKHCNRHSGLLKVENKKDAIATQSGSFRHEFRQSGIYYMQTEGLMMGETHLCVVHVRECPREHQVEILDRTFNPMILLIDEGDRVWFQWDKVKCKKPHNPYQIHHPSMEHDDDVAYLPVKDGFKWTQPTKCGLLSKEFFEPGVYFFSDQNFQEAAEYIGTILVKPKQKDHFIDLKLEGFSKDMLAAETGDRVWWTWNPGNMDPAFSIMEMERCLTPTVKPGTEFDCDDQCTFLEGDAAKQCTLVGLAAAQVNSIGVYHYRVADSPNTLSTCSIIVNSGSKNFTIHVTEKGFQPKVVTVHPSDRVWWVWQEGKKQHNIMQVSHEGNRIDDGFCSGAPLDPPSAFMHQFTKPGVYYYITQALPKLFGAIVVTSQPKVHEVAVISNQITPDPVNININDLVCWTFKGLRQYDVTEIESVDQLIGVESSGALLPRRCMNRAFGEAGVFHFSSKSFSKRKESKKEGPREPDESKLSSVLVDEMHDSMVVRVDSAGFHPKAINIIKGESILWTWKDSNDEAHNVIRVNAPDSETPLSAMQGGKSFNSGRPMPNNSFLYTFDEEGTFCVASQGAPGFCGIINIMSVDTLRTDVPYIESDQNGGTVEKNTVVYLACDTAQSSIYYTLDGSTPEVHRKSSKLYKPDKGVVLKESGLCFLRALATSPTQLISDVYTSKRFWVLRGPVEETPPSSPEPVDDGPSAEETQKWWRCIPSLQGLFTGPGVMELFWESPGPECLELIRGYQIFINDMTFCEVFPANHNSVNVAGLAGGRVYDILLDVYPENDKFLPHKSNKLMLKCPETTETGGPVISLEVPDNEDTMAIVWKSISTSQNPILGYRLYLNGQQCGDTVTPNEASNRCRCVIEGCQLDVIYRVVVMALPEGGSKPKMSNELEVSLPLDTSQIVLPPAELRGDDEDIYKDYIEVSEGSGYMPGMDEAPELDITERDDAENGIEDENNGYEDNILDGDQRLRYEGEGEEDSEHGLTPEQQSELPQQPSVSPQQPSDQGISVDRESEHGRSIHDEETRTNGGDTMEADIVGGSSRSDDPNQEQTAQISVDETAEYDEGVASASDQSGDEYQSHDHRVSNQVAEEPGLEIDGTRQPWRNKMKDTAKLGMHLSRGRHRKKSVEEKIEQTEVDNSPQTNYEVEMQDEVPSQSRPESVSSMGSGKRRRRKKRERRDRDNVVEVEESVDLTLPSNDTQTPSDKQPFSPTSVVSTVPLMAAMDLNNQDDFLPVPMVTVDHQGPESVLVRWKLPRQPEPSYRLLVYVVNVIGIKFQSEVNSDISFECLQEENGESIAAVQHCWNLTDSTRCLVEGLSPSTLYRIFVVANYSVIHAGQPCEIQATSTVIHYTSLGAPQPPTLSVTSLQLRQVTLSWEAGECHRDVEISGYKVYVDNKLLGDKLSAKTTQTTIDNIQPGKTIRVKVITLTEHRVGNSGPSNIVKVSCPNCPPPPNISQQPSYKRGLVIIAWEKPESIGGSDKREDILYYNIYLDGAWHGEIMATTQANKNGYQYHMTDLTPGQSYDIQMKAYAGDKRTEGNHVYCLSESIMSNSLPVMCPAPPKSPCLTIEGIHDGGIDVTWQSPQQYGDAVVSGYQLLKDNKLYGSTIPPDVLSLRIKDVSLGEKVTLQLVALTEHAVGKLEGTRVIGHHEIRHTNASTDGDSGIGRSSYYEKEEKEINQLLGEKYSACVPGPRLTIHYTGLVMAPTKVWCETVTGHSAMVVWNKGEKVKPHYVLPDSYQVTWWPGDKPEENINSQASRDDHLNIEGLDANTTYTVIVEARKLQSYTQTQEDLESDEIRHSFILTSKSEHIKLTTAQPPDPPTNLGILSSTCNSISVAWDPPREHGVEVIGIRVDCVPLRAHSNQHRCLELMPDSTCAVLENLLESTEYHITVTALTEEFFDQLPAKDKTKKSRTLPKDIIVQKASPWLPSSSIISMTSGTKPPCDVTVVDTGMDWVSIRWLPAQVNGTNWMQGTIVRWAEVKPKSQKNETTLANHAELMPGDTTLKIQDLQPGVQYKIVVEAVVSVKTTIKPGEGPDTVSDKTREGANRRTAHVMSSAVYVRTKAPSEPPVVLVTGFTNDSIHLYWEKPSMFTILHKEGDETPQYIRRCLEGYKLEINGKLHMKLGSAAQSCTLTKCRAGRTYNIVLIALTCTEDVKKERRAKKKALLESSSSLGSMSGGYNSPDLDEENDESRSETVWVVLPRTQEGNVESVLGTYNSDHDEMRLVWTVVEDSYMINQFNVVYFNTTEPGIERKCVNADTRACTLPVKTFKTVYEVAIEPVYDNDNIRQQPQHVHIQVPGAPDAPNIFARSIDQEEFVIEWGEPRTYGNVKIKGYQVYMNDKKVGNMLSASHRKAVIPCRPNRHYKINLTAVTAVRRFAETSKSNALHINTSSGIGGLFTPGSQSLSPDGLQSTMDSTHMGNVSDEISLKVVKVTDSTIHLDWSAWLEVDGLLCFKIQWSSVAVPAQREVKIASKERSCILQNCYPGTNHFVRILALGDRDEVLDKSRQLTVQTSASPDTPVLTLRACNFKYIAVQWEAPKTYGDALVAGYKVYVNGVVETILGPDQYTYAFTHGQWCHEYAFQIQALSTIEKLHSKPSEPFLVEWPGVRAPVLSRALTVSSNSIKIVWDTPYASEGVKLKMYKLLCIYEESNEISQTVSPIHPETKEAEVHNMKPGSYLVHLEVHVHGSNHVVRSESVRVQPTVTPDPPHITVTVVGLEERRQIQKVTANLLNKRDKLLSMIPGRPPSPMRMSHESQIYLKVSETLQQVEEMLDDCFSSLSHYTGNLLAHVSWQCPQSNPHVTICGFKVLIDGKQYGSTLHSGVKNVRIKLGLDKLVHKLTMVAVSEKPRTSSVPSNIVELLTDPFQPYTFFCFHTIHSNNAKWPNLGCCQYIDTLEYERRFPTRSYNNGLMQHNIPPPSCHVMDVFDGEFNPLLPPSGPDCPTVLFFWTRWCRTSQYAMANFVRFTREFPREYDYIAVSCVDKEKYPWERQELTHYLTENTLRDETIRHCLNISASSAYVAGSLLKKGMLAKHGKHDRAMSDKGVYGDINDLFNVIGVPTVVIIHPDDYIAWHGRYAALDYSHFKGYMQHALASIYNEDCSVHQCDTCQNETSIDIDNIEIGCKTYDRTSLLLHSSGNPSVKAKTGGTIATPSFSTNKKQTKPDDTLFTKSQRSKDSRQAKQEIDINVRPYSANAMPETPTKKKSRKPISAKRSR